MLIFLFSWQNYFTYKSGLGYRRPKPANLCMSLPVLLHPAVPESCYSSFGMWSAPRLHPSFPFLPKSICCNCLLPSLPSCMPSAYRPPDWQPWSYRKVFRSPWWFPSLQSTTLIVSLVGKIPPGLVSPLPLRVSHDLALPFSSPSHEYDVKHIWRLGSLSLSLSYSSSQGAFPLTCSSLDYANSRIKSEIFFPQ